MELYKVLNENGTPAHGGVGRWKLPTKDKPGKWMKPIEGELIPCQRAYHACRKEDLVYWLGATIYKLETEDTDILVHTDKVCLRTARLVERITNWNERTARLFACDCAERALTFVKQPDPRSVEAIRISRLFANGEVSDSERAAARAAARDAAWDAAGAARDAAWDAARAAARAAAWDARDAARDAAWDAAGAARAAAEAAERKWQTECLFSYLEVKE